MDLTRTVPHGELATSGYCLADPGREYLVFVPGGGGVTVDLRAARGRLAVEWFNPATGRKRAGRSVRGGGKRLLSAPFAGSAVVYLHAR